MESHNEFDDEVLTYVRKLKRKVTTARPPDPGSFAAGWGNAKYTLMVALHAVLTTDSFEGCIRVVGLAGGDTDTYGAVAGGLAGAIYGVDAIPKEWQETILGRTVMLGFANQFYQRWNNLHQR